MSVNRINHVFVDELGMDPLRDTSFDAIMSVQRYTTFTVTKEYENNAARISYLFYSTVNLWYAVLYYNKLADNWAIVEGMELRIPNQNELTSALNSVIVPDFTTQRI